MQRFRRGDIVLRALALVERYGIHAVAVWVKVSLEQALAQNLLRPADEIVPDFALRNVYSLLEPPTMDEGFTEILQIT